MTAATDTLPNKTLTGVGVWAAGLRWGDPAAAVEAAAELESLGYTALWIPDAGGDVFGAVEQLLDATSSVPIATGILNLWMHTPEETAAGHARLAESHGNRFLVGIGVSHAPMINAETPGRYTRPIASTRAFLDALDAAPTPLAPKDRVLAALGPKMLELAGNRTAGTHPYNVPPEHTALAREALGPDKLVLPEQAVALVNDPEQGRALGRKHLEHYFTLPNYVNNWRRLGYGDDDFADGGSDRLIDALIAWGDEDAIRARIQQHFDAGADHVCIQAISDQGLLPRELWRRLAPVLLD